MPCGLCLALLGIGSDGALHVGDHHLLVVLEGGHLEVGNLGLLVPVAHEHNLLEELIRLEGCRLGLVHGAALVAQRRLRGVREAVEFQSRPCQRSRGLGIHVPLHELGDLVLETQGAQPVRAQLLVVRHAAVTHALVRGIDAVEVANVVEQRGEDGGIVEARVVGELGRLQCVLRLAHVLADVIVVPVLLKEALHLRKCALRGGAGRR
mmetsp:Transcript_45123/g.141353  ORF Transcript_45123/g.141353 Transcript_45123/m.141353 type:complete len:208 (-) Transcript_45123:170-793(-)